MKIPVEFLQSPGIARVMTGLRRKFRFGNIVSSRTADAEEKPNLYSASIETEFDVVIQQFSLKSKINNNRCSSTTFHAEISCKLIANCKEWQMVWAQMTKRIKTFLTAPTVRLVRQH